MQKLKFLVVALYMTASVCPFVAMFAKCVMFSISALDMLANELLISQSREAQ